MVARVWCKCSLALSHRDRGEEGAIQLCSFHLGPRPNCGMYCEMSRCFQLLQDWDASVCTLNLGCFPFGSVNPTWKAAYIWVLCGRAHGRVKVPFGCQVCGMAKGTMRDCFPVSLVVLACPWSSWCWKPEPLQHSISWKCMVGPVQLCW